MALIIPSEYQNIVNTVNIFQLAGDAEQPQKTMSRNVKRIVQFYRGSAPRLRIRDCKVLAQLLQTFYVTANFYHFRGTYAEFIVNDFNLIENDEWLTIVQFINFIEVVLRTSNNVNQVSILRVLRVSRQIKHNYYSKHIHTVVPRTTFNQIIKQDFYGKGDSL